VKANQVNTLWACWLRLMKKGSKSARAPCKCPSKESTMRTHRGLRAVGY